MTVNTEAAALAAVQLVVLATVAGEVRRHRGLSARGAGREIGVTASTLRRVEQGQPCSTDTAIKIFTWIGRHDLGRP